MIFCASILPNKSLIEEATKCLFRTSLRSTHSIIVACMWWHVWHVQTMTTRASHYSLADSPTSRNDCWKNSDLTPTRSTSRWVCLTECRRAHGFGPSEPSCNESSQRVWADKNWVFVLPDLAVCVLCA